MLLHLGNIYCNSEVNVVIYLEQNVKKKKKKKNRIKLYMNPPRNIQAFSVED